MSPSLRLDCWVLPRGVFMVTFSSGLSTFAQVRAVPVGCRRGRDEGGSAVHHGARRPPSPSASRPPILHGTPPAFMDTLQHAHPHTHTRTHARTHTHTHARAHTHTHTHARARAHTHARARTDARTDVTNTTSLLWEGCIAHVIVSSFC